MYYCSQLFQQTKQTNPVPKHYATIIYKVKFMITSNQFPPIQNYYLTMVIHFTYLNTHFVLCLNKPNKNIHFFQIFQIPAVTPTLSGRPHGSADNRIKKIGVTAFTTTPLGAVYAVHLSRQNGQKTKKRDRGKWDRGFWEWDRGFWERDQ